MNGLWIWSLVALFNYRKNSDDAVKNSDDPVKNSDDAVKNSDDTVKNSDDAVKKDLADRAFLWLWKNAVT